MLKDVTVDDQAGSVNERESEKMSGKPEACCLGEGWTMLYGVRIPISEVDELVPGNGGVTFVLRASCLRPARLVTKYSHGKPRLPQRAHVGFSLLHLTLEAAQAWQLSRSLGAAETADCRIGAGCVRGSGECISAMVG